jgi:DNA (cytosine-5)-methyltransferase 1
MGLDRVLADLTFLGYDAEWQVIRASDVGANHRRERIIIVAYPDERTMERGVNGGISPEAFGGRRTVFVAPTSSGSTAGVAHFPRFPEPGVGRIAHGIPNRLDRLRGLGNAVVPQVAEYVGQMIMASL